MAPFLFFQKFNGLRRSQYGLLVVFILLLVLLPFGTQGAALGSIVPGGDSCGFISGLSDDSVDFEYGDWTIDRSVDETLILEENRLCLGEAGNVEGTSIFAWHPEAEWVDFTLGLDEAYEAKRLRVDLALQGELAYTGHAYWSGYAWSDVAGWIWFDWTDEDCSECTIENRVHTLLPEGWPNNVVGAETLFNVEGYAWTEHLGWIDFGSEATDSTNVLQELLFTQKVVSVIPVVSFASDSGDVPVADGSDAYEVIVQLWVPETEYQVGGYYLDDVYFVNITVESTADSHVYRDQVDRTGNAIVIDPVAYDADAEAFRLAIHSWAPTSSQNGYDEDGDGEIDFYFDKTADQTKRSGNENHYEIAEIAIEVFDEQGNPITVEDNGPLWDLTENSLTPLALEFKPAFDLPHLEYRESDTAYGAYIPYVPEQEMLFDGFVSVNSNDLLDKSFTVNAHLGIQDSRGDYDFLLDTNGDGYYLPTDDQTSVSSTFTISDPGDNALLDDFDSKMTRFVSLEDGDFFLPISAGSFDLNSAMMTDIAGDPPASLSPDLVVKEVYVDPDTREVNVLLANVGWADVPFETPVKTQLKFTYSVEVTETIVTEEEIYIDESYCTEGEIAEGNCDYYGEIHYNPGDEYFTVVTTETVTTVEERTDTVDYISDVDDRYLLTGQASWIAPSTSPAEQATLEVCVDVAGAVAEIDDVNNCFGAEYGDYPDLTIERIYLEAVYADTFYLRNIQANHGVADVPEAYWNGSEDGVADGITRIDIVDYKMTAYHWSTLSDKSFVYVGGSANASPRSLTVGYTVNTCIDYADYVQEIREDNNCRTIFLEPDEYPFYETDIAYDVTGDGVYDVRYYSNYLPQYFLQDLSGENVPVADEYKYPAVVSGSITGATTDLTLTDSDDFVVIGDLSTQTIRNELFKRFSSLTKGVTPNLGNVTTNTLSGAMQPSETARLLLENESGESTLVYFLGDTVLRDLDDMYTSKTIVVLGGDLFIDDDILGRNPTGFVVFKGSDGSGGNIYIHPEVTDLLNVNFYADGSILSYTGSVNDLDLEGYDGSYDQLVEWADADQRRDVLSNQLYCKGSIISQNTIGGAEVYPYILPDGSENSDDASLARSYDLNHLREFRLCWTATDVAGLPVDQDGDGITVEADGTVDFGDVDFCFDYRRAESLNDTGDPSTSDNEPIHLEYSPPPSTLPILGESSGGGVTAY